MCHAERQEAGNILHVLAGSLEIQSDSRECSRWNIIQDQIRWRGIALCERKHLGTEEQIEGGVWDLELDVDWGRGWWGLGDGGKTDAFFGGDGCCEVRGGGCAHDDRVAKGGGVEGKGRRRSGCESHGAGTDARCGGEVVGIGWRESTLL